SGMSRSLRRGLRATPAWVRRRLRRRAVVLMYHGIGDVGIDPWGLFVSPANFAEQLEVLNDVAKPMRLSDLGRACATGALPASAAAVTFDDGYVNNLRQAKPLLEAHAVPATVFAISQPMAGPSEYWWDELAGVILTPGELPSFLDLSTVESDQVIEVGAATSYSTEAWQQDHRYRDEEQPAGPRMELYRRLWRILLALDDPQRRLALREIADWAGSPATPRESHRSVTADELVALDGGVVDIGGHTVSHPLLPDLSPDRQRIEIGDNKRDLETILDRPLDSFSYPFGAHDETSVRAARGAGYHLAVTTRPTTTAAGVDSHRIGRFDVKDWTGEEFERRLRSWIRYR
ncbi:MAG: polysaccharide deacetylase family protein, partial [Acidimicrobiales bacterium]